MYTDEPRRALPQTWATPSQHFRPYVNDIAKRPQFSHVVFVEVDVDQMSVRGDLCLASHASQQPCRNLTTHFQHDMDHTW